MCETCMERELRAFWSRFSYWNCLAHDALDLSYFLLFFSAHAFLIFPTRQYSLRYERSHDTEVGLCFASPLPLSCDRCAEPLNAELSHFRRMTTLLLQPILSSKRKKKKLAQVGGSRHCKWSVEGLWSLLPRSSSATRDDE